MTLDQIAYCAFALFIIAAPLIFILYAVFSGKRAVARSCRTRKLRRR